MALRLVARAEQSRAGLLRKLQMRGVSRKTAASAIDILEKSGLVDDFRFARLWVASRILHKRESPRSLRCALLQRGIDRSTATDAVQEILSAQVEEQLLERYLNAVDSESHTEIKRILRREGFDSQMIDAHLTLRNEKTYETENSL